MEVTSKPPCPTQVYASKDACDLDLAASICDAASNPVGPDAFASILFSGKAKYDFDDLLARLAKKKIDVALVYGKDDPWITPIWGQRAARRLRAAGADDVHYYEISPAGHCPHHEAPEAVATVFDDWRRSRAIRVGGDVEPDRPSFSSEATERDGRVIASARVDGAPRGLVELAARVAWG